MNDLLMIYDDDLNEIGVAPRSDVHARGLLHKVVHCWLVGKDQSSDWLYLQQRSSEASFSGWYDIAAAGHLDPGENPEQAVVRETHEELGVVIDPKALEYLGSFREVFRYGSYYDNELCQVYLYPVNEGEFLLGDEVERMIKVPVGEFARWVGRETDMMCAFAVGDNETVPISTNQIIPHEQPYFSFVLAQILKTRG